MHIGDVIELRNTAPTEDRFRLWNDIYERHYRQPGPPNRDSGATTISNNLINIFGIYAGIYLFVNRL